jgi:hypothetical protein
MIEKMSAYHKLVFGSSDGAGRASDALMKWASRKDGVLAIAHAAASAHHRIVMWEGTQGIVDTDTLYVSEGALNVLQRLQPGLPAGEVISAADLPDDRRLMIGDDRDWQNK